MMAGASWSRDGKWIYFHSDRSGEHQVWKMPAGGGEARPGDHKGWALWPSNLLTANGFITRKPWDQQPLESAQRWRGGDPSARIRRWERLWHRERRNLFHSEAGCCRPLFHPILQLRDQKIRSISTIESAIHANLSVSPDGRWILYSQMDQLGSDLMLVENFR